MSLIEEIKAKFLGKQEIVEDPAIEEAPAEPTAQADMRARIVITYPEFGSVPEVHVENYNRLTTTRLQLLPQIIWREVCRKRSTDLQAMRMVENNAKEKKHG